MGDKESRLQEEALKSEIARLMTNYYRSTGKRIHFIRISETEEEDTGGSCTVCDLELSDNGSYMEFEATVDVDVIIEPAFSPYASLDIENDEAVERDCVILDEYYESSFTEHVTWRRG